MKRQVHSLLRAKEYHLHFCFCFTIAFLLTGFITASTATTPTLGGGAVESATTGGGSSPVHTVHTDCFISLFFYISNKGWVLRAHPEILGVSIRCGYRGRSNEHLKCN